jgi:hypothetical protein
LLGDGQRNHHSSRSAAGCPTDTMKLAEGINYPAGACPRSTSHRAGGHAAVALTCTYAGRESSLHSPGERCARRQNAGDRRRTAGCRPGLRAGGRDASAGDALAGEGHRRASAGSVTGLVERDAMVHRAAAQLRALDAEAEGLVFGRLDSRPMRAPVPVAKARSSNAGRGRTWCPGCPRRRRRTARSS